MLVLARRRGEKICIGNGIVVTIVALVGNRVCVGIEAPTGISIDREELRHRKNAGLAEGGRYDVAPILPQ
jgi:carbon storage regulator